MRRLMALFLVCLLVLSHGTMGQAAPHAGEAHHIDSDLHDADHVGDDHGANVKPAADEDRDRSAAHGVHVHVAGDLVDVKAAPVPVLATSAGLTHADKVTVLPSRMTAPLLEPPAA